MRKRWGSRRENTKAKSSAAKPNDVKKTSLATKAEVRMPESVRDISGSLTQAAFDNEVQKRKDKPGICIKPSDIHSRFYSWVLPHIQDNAAALKYRSKFTTIMENKWLDTYGV